MDTVVNIASWMDTMHLKLNPDKTEFIVFSYRNQLDKCKTSYVTISGSTIPKSPSVKYLRVTLDENLNLKEHILTKCRIAIANFFRICNIQQYLTTDACTTLVLGLCVSAIWTMQMLCTMDFLIKQFCTCRWYSQCVQNLPLENPSMTAQQMYYHSFTGSPLNTESILK